MALFFCIIMYLSMAGGAHKLPGEVVESKHNLYYILVNLLLSSLLALVYTNDMFTAYVFVEINTISACGLIMIRQVGRTIEAAVRARKKAHKDREKGEIADKIHIIFPPSLTAWKSRPDPACDTLYKAGSSATA